MLLRAAFLLLPLAAATGGQQGGPDKPGGGKGRHCPTKTVEVCAEE